MAENWLGLDELMELTGWPPRTVQRKVKSGLLISRPTKERGANGRPRREYSSRSLPIDLQVELNRRRVALVAPDSLISKDNGSQLCVFGAEKIAADAPRLAVTAEQKEQITTRWAIISPMVEYANLASAAERRAWCGQNGRNVDNLDDLAKQIANEQNCGHSTIWRWYGAFRRSGANGLFDRFRSDKGESRWFAQHRKAAILAAHLYLNEKTSISFVAEQIAYEAATLGLSVDELPSRETVRVFLSQSISPAMRTLARQGSREYRERMAPYLKRGYVDVFANQIWVGDHAIHDAEISNDLFAEVPFGTPGRLRMSAFVDYRSRKAWATWAWEGSSRSISATLIRAMLEVGPPEGVYVDNGKDYKKVANGAMHACELPRVSDDDDLKAPRNWWQEEYKSIEQTGALSRLGITVTHCIPRHPQSKHVERFFRTMHMHFDAVHSTYTSGSPFTRPESTEKAMMRHRRLLKAGRVSESKHPLASRFILGCLAWIAEYNDTPQRGEGMDGRSPNDIFNSERNPNQRPVPDAATLALLFCDRVRRTVRECAIQLNKYRYTPRPEDRLAWAAMHEANETEILVDWNPEDPEFALALTLDGRILAWLEAEPLLRFAPNDPATQAQIADSMSIRRGLEKATKQTLKAIEVAARAGGAQSAEEMLYGRLQLPAASGSVISHRKTRFRPEKEAVAPPSAAEIADDFTARLWEQRAG